MTQLVASDEHYVHWRARLKFANARTENDVYIQLPYHTLLLQAICILPLKANMPTKDVHFRVVPVSFFRRWRLREIPWLWDFRLGFLVIPGYYHAEFPDGLVYEKVAKTPTSFGP